MKQRCHQVPKGRDQSDENQLIVTKEGSNNKLPPITVKSSGQSTFPVPLKISIDLLQIIDMKEQDHNINLQFQWRDNSRVVSQNVKQKKSVKALSDK